MDGGIRNLAILAARLVTTATITDIALNVLATIFPNLGPITMHNVIVLTDM
jgi:hypothetical protein